MEGNLQLAENVGLNQSRPKQFTGYVGKGNRWWLEPEKADELVYQYWSKKAGFNFKRRVVYKALDLLCVIEIQVASREEIWVKRLIF